MLFGHGDQTMNTPQPKTYGDPYLGVKWLIIGVLVAAAIYCWANSSPQRASHPRRLSPAESRQLYRSQFSSEQERLEFEDWQRGQHDLQRDAPIGQTRGGDGY
jgi:hypothetical protein